MSDLFESGVFGNNTAAWHKKGKVVTGTFSLGEGLRDGDLDWETEKSPLHTIYHGQSVAVPEKFAVCRTDNGRVLGVVGPEYRTISNRESFSFCESLLADKTCRWETAISLDQGRQVAGIISLPDSKVEILKGDAHYLYLTVITSHDGSAALKAFPTDVRVVCANTARAALSSANKGLTVSIRHSGNIQDKLAAAQMVIARARSDFAAFVEWQKIATNIGVKKDDYETLCEELFPVPTADDNGKVSDRAQTIRKNKVLQLTAAVKAEVLLLPMFTATPGFEKSRVMSAYTFLNAVTRYVDHDLAASKGDDRGAYALMNGGVDVKARAVSALQKVYPALAIKGK